MRRAAATISGGEATERADEDAEPVEVVGGAADTERGAGVADLDV